MLDLVRAAALIAFTSSVIAQTDPPYTPDVKPASDEAKAALANLDYLKAQKSFSTILELRGDLKSPSIKDDLSAILADAESKERQSRAEIRFKVGKELFDQGIYEDSRRELESALDILPDHQPSLDLREKISRGVETAIIDDSVQRGQASLRRENCGPPRTSRPSRAPARAT